MWYYILISIIIYIFKDLYILHINYITFMMNKPINFNNLHFNYNHDLLFYEDIFVFTEKEIKLSLFCIILNSIICDTLIKTNFVSKIGLTYVFDYNF